MADKIDAVHVPVEHTYYKCPPGCDDAYCMFCSGGLGHCTVCNGFEGTLTTECCGRRITEAEEHDIYNRGVLDFNGGQWVAKEPRHG